VKLSVLKKVQSELERVIADPQKRVAIDKTVRPLMWQIAVPLKLGDMGETHFVLGDHWTKHFRRKHSQDGGPLTVAKMREWMDDPEPRGLPAWVQNLLILSFADVDSRSFSLHGGPGGRVALDYLPNELELRTIALPTEENWNLARQRVQKIFGLDPFQHLNASNVEKLAEDVQALLTPLRPDCENLCRKLRERMRAFGLEPEATARVQTANAVLALVEAVHAADSATAVVNAIAAAEVRTSEAAMGNSLKKAGAVCGGLDGINWEIFEASEKLTDQRAAEAASIRERVKDALGADEYATALIPALQRLQSKALELITRIEPAPLATPQPGTLQLEGREVGLTRDKVRELFQKLDDNLGKHPSRRLEVHWKITGKG
jgi:hypothetical protein